MKNVEQTEGEKYKELIYCLCKNVTPNITIREEMKKEKALSDLWQEYKLRVESKLKEDQRIRLMQNELRAALDKDEDHINQINTKALCQLCLRYDLYYNDYPEHEWEGLSLYRFFLCVTNAGINSMQWDAWEEELEVEWERKKEEEESVGDREI